MKTNEDGKNLIKDFERCMLKAYPDPCSELAKACRKAGVVIYDYAAYPGWQCLDGTPWTIGWGHTGPEVVPGLVWSQEKADRNFDLDLVDRELVVTRLAKASKVPMTNPNQFAALVSFVYNCGFKAGKNIFRNCIAVDPDSGEAKLDPKLVAEYLVLFSHSHGREVPGLARRRREEVDLFLKVDYA